MSRGLFALMLVLLLGGCGREPASQVASVEARLEPFTVLLRGDGQLHAAESVPIVLPPTVGMAQTIAWTVDDFSQVRAGDVVVRFDGVSFEEELARAEFEMQRLDLQSRTQDSRQQSELMRIEASLREVGLERALAERFPIVDERLFSRNEIIDALADLGLLDAQESFFSWRQGHHAQLSEAERRLLRAQRGTFEQRHELNAQLLAGLEIRAPRDGVFVLETNWSGEKITRGQTVFPGNTIARIPLAGAVEARLHILESEAAGLQVGQRARVRVDAAPERVFSGEVTRVDSVAAPRERGSPIKFFGLTVLLDEHDPELTRIGSRVSAEIIVGERAQALTVPAQAVVEDGSRRRVQVIGPRGSEWRTVGIGLRSPTRVEITSGLEAGERVALVPQRGSNGGEG